MVSKYSKYLDGLDERQKGIIKEKFERYINKENTNEPYIKSIFQNGYIQGYLDAIKVLTNELYPQNNTQNTTEPSKSGYYSSYMETQESKGGGKC